MTATVIPLPGLRPPPPAAPPRRQTAEERDRALHAELRRARIRIAQLEALLAEADSDASAGHARLANCRSGELSG